MRRLLVGLSATKDRSARSGRRRAGRWLVPDAAEQVDAGRWTKEALLVAVRLLGHFGVNDENALVLAVTQVLAHHAAVEEAVEVVGRRVG